GRGAHPRPALGRPHGRADRPGHPGVRDGRQAPRRPRLVGGRIHRREPPTTEALRWSGPWPPLERAVRDGLVVAPGVGRPYPPVRGGRMSHNAYETTNTFIKRAFQALGIDGD